MKMKMEESGSVGWETTAASCDNQELCNENIFDYTRGFNRSCKLMVNVFGF